MQVDSTLAGKWAAVAGAVVSAGETWPCPGCRSAGGAAGGSAAVAGVTTDLAAVAETTTGSAAAAEISTDLAAAARAATDRETVEDVSWDDIGEFMPFC